VADTPLVRLQAVSRRYGEYSALSGVDLEIQRGEFVAVMGRSGSGKTTLLNILGLLDRPTDGCHEFGGEVVESAGQRKRARIRAENIGFVFQAGHLIPSRSALANVELALMYRSMSRSYRVQVADELLRSVGLAARTGSLPATLSAGEQQRVALARALVTRPTLLLCDEPTGNLDNETARSIMDLVRAVPDRGSAVVLVTHDVSIAGYADRTVMLRDGRTVE